jgi:hypothetical protein
MDPLSLNGTSGTERDNSPLSPCRLSSQGGRDGTLLFREVPSVPLTGLTKEDGLTFDFGGLQ